MISFKIFSSVHSVRIFVSYCDVIIACERDNMAREGSYLVIGKEMWK